MEHLIAVVIGLVGTYAVSMYFGRQTDRLIASCSDRTGRLIDSSSKRVESLMVLEAAETRALLERLGQVSKERHS